MIATNAFKQAVVGTYTNSDTVIELNSISNTIGNADYLPNGGFNLILYDGLFGNPADANNAGKYEILECSSVNYATNEITVVRARENTTAVTIDASSWQVVYGATVAFFAQFEDADATILKEADVVDTLVSTSITAPLSANQGKVLQDNKEPADATILKQANIVDNLTSTSTTAPLSANQGKQLEDTKIATSAIVNDLTTGGTDVPLSAEQGKELDENKAGLAGGADANFTAMPQVGGVEILNYGTYTPAISGTTGTIGSYNASTALGEFIEFQIGSTQFILVGFDIILTNKGSWTGSSRISLPEVPTALSDTISVGSAGIGNIDLLAGYTYATINLRSSDGAFARLLRQGSDVFPANISMTQLSNNSSISGQIIYKI